MNDPQPTQTKNLDGYGNPPLEWSRVLKALKRPPTENRTWFLGTVRPDGGPAVAGVGALYIDGDVWIVSGPGTRKSRNLAAHPECTIAVSVEALDLTFEGTALRVTDTPTLERVVEVFKEGGWPAEVEGDAFTAPFSAPSAGPPPWHVYRFRFNTVFAVAGEEPNGATRWRFEGAES